MKKALSLLGAGLFSAAAFAQVPHIVNTEGFGRYHFVDQDAMIDARLDRGNYDVKNMNFRLWIDNHQGLTDEVILPTLQGIGNYTDNACNASAPQNRPTDVFGAESGTPGTDNYIYGPLWVAGADVYGSVKAKYCDDSWAPGGYNGVGFSEELVTIVDVRSLTRNSLGEVLEAGGCNRQVIGSFSVSDGAKTFSLEGLDIEIDNLTSSVNEAQLGSTLRVYYENYVDGVTFDGNENYFDISGTAVNYNSDPALGNDNRYTGIDLNVALNGRKQFYVTVCLTPALAGQTINMVIRPNAVWLTGNGHPNGQVRVDQIPISTLVTLPVEFRSIKAELAGNNTGKVTWYVANEQNLSRYELQKSTDGVNFQTIATVTPTNASVYSALDNNLSDMNIYRVKSIDVDGKFLYSSTVALNVRGTSSTTPFIAGNPVINNTVKIVNTKPGTKINIVENTGRVLVSWTATNTIEMKDISRLPAGYYVVVINDRGTIKSLKFNKQ